MLFTVPKVSSIEQNCDTIVVLVLISLHARSYLHPLSPPIPDWLTIKSIPLTRRITFSIIFLTLFIPLCRALTHQIRLMFYIFQTYVYQCSIAHIILTIPFHIRASIFCFILSRNYKIFHGRLYLSKFVLQKGVISRSSLEQVTKLLCWCRQVLLISLLHNSYRILLFCHTCVPKSASSS